MTRDQEVFLGFLRDQDHDRYQHSPLVGTYDGRPAAVWSFGDGGPPHAGIWGTTGGGKSSLIRMILRGLVRRPGPRAITVIDAEGAGEFSMFRRMPGVAQIINVDPTEPATVEQAAQAIADHLALSIERNKEREAAATAWEEYLVDPIHHQPPKYVAPAEVFLVIDGRTTLSYILNRYLKAHLDPEEDQILIGRNGRKTDVHLMLADQVSYAKRSKADPGLPSELKKQLGLRIAAVGPLGMTNSEAGMVFDNLDAGYQIPKDLGGCLMKVGATVVPFVVPPWRNATDPRTGLTANQRRDAYRLLPPPEAAA